MASGQRNIQPKGKRGGGKVPRARGSQSDMRRSGQPRNQTATQEAAVRTNRAASLTRAPAVQSSTR